MTARATYRFARTPEWVLYHKDLDAVDVRVFGVLDRHDGRDCFPALATVGDLIGKSEQTVRRSLRNLAAVGAILIEARYEHGRQSSNRYTLAGDSPLTRRPATDDRAGVPPVEPGDPVMGDTQSRAREDLEQDNESNPAADAADRTPAQEAQRVLDDYWRFVTSRSGRKPIGITAIAFKKLITPFLEAGIPVVDLKFALSEMYVHGATLTRQGIERQLDGRVGRNGKQSTMDKLREAQFDDAGMLVVE